MRAVIRRGGALVVGEMAPPVPQAGQALVRTLACGICGSDLHALDHYDHMIELSERLGAPGHMKRGADTVFGHEFCCELIEYGPGGGRFKAGTRVVSIPGLVTPAGFETVGYSSRIPGGFAETIVLSDMLMVEVPNGLAAESAALTEPLAVGEHAVARAEPEADHVFMVVGAGPVGLAVIASLKARGLGPVIACDFSPERRAAAERMGADVLIDPAQVSPHASWSELGVPAGPVEGLMAAAAGKAVKRPLIFECVGAPGVLQSLAMAAPRGTRVVVAGVCMQTDEFEPFAFIAKEIDLRFVLGYTPEEFAASLRNLAEGLTGYNAIVTGVVGLDETPAAFTALQTDKSQIKILVKPGG
ncbi:MAG TPA: zinc-binding dehydrogenase [Caulobacteraceae bacterium]|jgi:threonine dehydrogenase-like Zn-dependent dehydrogenase|nr:zinc-binding dehydrogenase [Caulobacteraceae bacterium]